MVWLLGLVAGPLMAVGGWKLGIYLGEVLGQEGYIPWGLALTIVGALLGLLAVPYVARPILRKLKSRLAKVSTTTIVVGVIGSLAGLVAAALISFPLMRLAGWVGLAIPLAIALFFGASGWLLLITREQDIIRLLFHDHGGHTAGPAAGHGNGRILLDTSAIIDGRIADISRTGFLRGTLVIPQFVLDELRHIADSSDSMRRNRGRRGLEMLNKLRKEKDVPLQIMDTDVKDVTEVDAKLVKLAKSLNAPIVTTDYNLNRVAEIQGARVLNINDLANSLKPLVLPGEEMTVRVIQEGKEPGQGVAFLDDGTMVVVEGGRRYINSHLDVLVTKVLQTSAGRLIFAQPKEV